MFAVQRAAIARRMEADQDNAFPLYSASSGWLLRAGPSQSRSIKSIRASTVRFVSSCWICRFEYICAYSCIDRNERQDRIGRGRLCFHRELYVAEEKGNALLFPRQLLMITREI